LAYESTAVQTPDVKTGISQHEGYTITRTPDGQVTVEGSQPLKARIPRSGDFDENLAECMESSERRLLAMRLSEFCEADIKSRSDWENREKTSMEMLGLKETSPAEGDDEQLGGHDTTHPMLMEATSRFQANAIVELFPPQGPAETKILGKQTEPKLARAKRVRTFCNHYLTDVDEGGLHPGQDPGHLALIEVPDDPAVGFPLDEDLGNDAIVQERDLGLLGGAAHDEVLGQGRSLP